MKNICIIQARQTSNRLPNKVLKKIGTKNIINIIYERLLLSKKIDHIIFAVPNNSKNSQLRHFLKKSKIPYFQGSEKNVLNRFTKYLKSKKSMYEIVIRITCDCPLIDPLMIDKMIMKFMNNKFDYISNVMPPTFPDGFDFEIFRKNLLTQVDEKSLTPEEKEHVTLHIRKDPKVNKFNLTHRNFDLSYIKLSVDTNEDLKNVKDIYKYFDYDYSVDYTKIEKYLKEFKIIDEAFLKKYCNKTGQKLWKDAKKIIAGGNMLLSKNPDTFLPKYWPSYFSKTKGCNVWDLDNNKYIDFTTMGVGTNILGYSNNKVDKKVKEIIDKGNLSTLNSPEEVELSRRILSLHKWADTIRYTRSGGEANAVAIRLARSFVQKDNVAICGYHGWHDWYLSTNLNNPSSLNKLLFSDLKISGVNTKLKNTVFAFKFNNFDSLKKIIKSQNIGTIKMEVQRNKSPDISFLKKVRKLCDQKNIVLIFDECTSGFRESLGGIHLNYGVNPDICILGKALGNGYAINAILGRKKVMDSINNTFISSTFWTERIGYAAALATLKEMERLKSYKIITDNGLYFRKKFQILAKQNKLKIKLYGIPSLSTFEIISKNWQFYKIFITQEMLKFNILASNSIYFSIFHDKKKIDFYLTALKEIFKKIKVFENEGMNKNYLVIKKTKNLFRKIN